MKRFRDTEAWKWIRTLLEMAAFALFVLVIIWLCAALGISEAHAAKEPQEMWVICQPDDVVYVREKATKKSNATSELKPGTLVLTDGKKRNGFTHLVNLNSETGEGWVRSIYLVEEEPEVVNRAATVVSKGRLAARRSIDGERVKWLKPGQTVTVHFRTEDWCVTDKGYVMTKYLEIEGD